MPKLNVLLIVNPAAGRQIAKKALFRIVDALCRRNCKTTVFSTAEKGDAIKWVAQYARQADRIICCGGDGTLNEVISGMIQFNVHVPVGFIPTGTTNDLAHSLHLPLHINNALEAAVNGRIHKHDVGMFNKDKYFTYVASFGAFTNVAYTTPQRYKQALGRLAYLLKGLVSLAAIQPRKAKIIADGAELEGDFIYGSVSNTSVIGGGVIKFLESDIGYDDGKFEMLLVKKPKRLSDIRGIVKSVSGRRYDSAVMLYRKVSNLTFTFEKETEWTLDGEYAGKEDTVQITILSSAVSVMKA